VLQHFLFAPDLCLCDYNLIPKTEEVFAYKTIKKKRETDRIILIAIWCNIAQNSMSGDVNGVCHFLHHWQQTADNPGGLC